jgi:hypothetical protein
MNSTTLRFFILSLTPGDVLVAFAAITHAVLSE